MSSRRLEARLVAPGPARTWQRSVREVAKTLEAKLQGDDGYIELAIPAHEGRPAATLWAVWWEAEGDIVLDLCLQDDAQGMEPGRLRAGLLQIFEWFRDGTRARATDVVIKAASKPPLRARKTAGQGRRAEAPTSKPVSFERMSKWDASDAGYQARCPHCGGFSNHPEPGRVLCRYCSQWFTLQP